MPPGQPGAERLRDHVTLNSVGFAPGCNVTTCAAPPGEQSSLDHTRSLPLMTRISRLGWPTSYVHGAAPVFATPIVRTGRRPAGYSCASARALTARSAARHRPAGPVVGEAVREAVGEAVARGVRVAVALGDGVGVACTDVRGSPSDPHARLSRNSTSTTTSSVTARRRQYTPGGNGPRGCSSASASIGGEPTMPGVPPFARAVLDWYAAHARDLPWRRTTDPWAVLVSEVMLQQTPVARVLPAYDAWLARWPTPAALAADSPGEAVRLWGRLGYPRRALRLHDAATAITAHHGGAVPADLGDLLALPGVGAYTARAVASFAFGQRHPVVDTNVRRVVARVVAGQGEAGPPRVAADLAAVEAIVPDDDAPRFGVAVMELGALVCTARTPRCAQCPVAALCAWRLAGYPAYDGPRAPRQGFAGTDRQARGALLAVLRDAPGPVPRGALDAAWPHDAQRARALDGLVLDGLVEPTPDGRFALPA